MISVLLLILLIVSCLIVGFALGYSFALHNTTNNLAKLTSEELRKLAAKVAERRGTK